MDDAWVIVDESRHFDDGTVVRVRVLRVPASDTYPEGYKYGMQYGVRGGETIVRFDNHHGPHELHLGDETFTHETTEWRTIYDCFRASLPADKRTIL